jgi:hypothetical protein
MKLRITIASTVVAAMAVAVFALFSACESVSLEEVFPQAELLTLTITTQANKVIEIAAIPAAIRGEEWNDEEYIVGGADLGLIPVKNAAETEEVRLTVTASPGARVLWGTGRSGNRPDRFNDTRVRATFDTEEFLYVKVTADDGVTSNYYRFYSVLASPVKELAALAIAGRDPNELTIKDEKGDDKKVRVATAAPSLEFLSDNINNASFRAQIDITRGEARDGAVVAATPQESNATIRYAVAASLAAARAGTFSDFKETIRRVIKDEQDKDIYQAYDTLTFTDGNILAVEVTPANEEPANYYGFQITAGRMATIAALKFDGVEAKGIGTQAAQWGSVTPGTFASADQLSDGFKIDIELNDPDGLAEYALINTTGAGNPSTYGTAEKIRFNDKQALAIRVTSARGSVVGSIDTRYYKVRIDLLATNFKQQPKSAAYTVTSHDLPLSTVNFEYKGASLSEQRVLVTADSSSIVLDRAIEPLSVVFDREDTGFSYQWYESNSWYGGYGFDRDGKIYGDPGYGEGLTQAQRDLLGSGLDWDEKFNISIHNGGNNYYRLPIPGRPIPGETNPTYTPKIDASKRPFNTGFSNSSHYYWVVVTDSSNRVATSERATIVAEWSQLWYHGRPTGDKIEKKHHIVDLYAYMTPNAVGLRDNPRNETAFKAGNHADKYLIPMTFPLGFNIQDYSVVTCQAKFYLADGRAWIQNWTQGDFGFANASKENLVLWYNLTNDNATRGLSGSGNEPQGSGLTVIPAYLVIQPAGTKPIKEMPPFNDNGQPVNNGDAQGWFTPYIEVVELRFEGPKR